MKKTLSALLFGIVLSGAAFALQYALILYDFQGLNSSGNLLAAPNNQLSKMLNFTYDYSGKNISSFKGVSKVKYPAGNLITLTIPGRGRGLYQFYPNQGAGLSSLVISARCINDYLTGEVFYNSTTMETTAGVPFTTLPYHTNFESFFDPFRATDTLYIANGDTYKKWFRDVGTSETIISPIYDTGQTTVNLNTTNTWTNSSTTVTAITGTFDTTAVVKGAWVKVNASGPFYEINYVTSSSTIELRTSYDGSTTTDASGKVAAPSGLNPRFVHYWFNRLWLASFGRVGTDSIVGTAVVGTAKFGVPSIYRQGMVLCSAAVSSTTPNALEDYSGSDTGYIYVGQNDNVTWLTSLSDYLFVFKEKQYIIYRYNSAYLPPIVEVNRFDYGNLGQVVNAGNSLIYFTGKEVRQTNGFSDVKISDDIDSDIKQQNYYSNSFSDFYSCSATDNYYPTAAYDKSKNQYTLYISPRDSNFNISSTLRYGYTYDMDNKKWIGTAGNVNVGNIINYYPQTSSDIQMAYLPYTSDTTIKYFDSRGVFDNQTQGVIESADLSLDSPGVLKNIQWVEFWVNRPPVSSSSESVTLSFNYYADGNLKLTTYINKTISPLTDTITAGSSQIQKVRFPVNVQCSFFKWRLKDVAWASGATNGLSLLGGQICYSTIIPN